ncbi:metal-dependent transcriptional regulator [Pengzhenrongella sicca]|uniref:Manganese transport regulator n=1 Tax=Pengzhenrongella sicca TaxID=2819238 RepID=A0A8A4ZAR1_9MICO|nr:metal-dependent transcriptional regulator [Pengzhenrongella sicca]QTE28501.1 metal-dependent transcriptional regulator [Pengzhenrongella sicca]
MSTAEPADLTAVAQDYLKVIWTAREWSTAPVTTKLLAARLRVGAPTVSEMVRRLGAQGLVDHAPYGSIELTALGRAHAVAMVRRHRLIETLLVQELGYSWDEVHDEAEVLEHAVSDLLVERIAARLGHPDRDPHGDPIPTADGHVPTPAAQRLWDLGPGEWVLARVSDADPGVLRLCAAHGLRPDVRITVVAARAGDGPIALRVGGRELTLEERPASALWVLPAT